MAALVGIFQSFPRAHPSAAQKSASQVPVMMSKPVVMNMNVGWLSFGITRSRMVRESNIEGRTPARQNRKNHHVSFVRWSIFSSRFAQL